MGLFEDDPKPKPKKKAQQKKAKPKKSVGDKLADKVKRVDFSNMPTRKGDAFSEIDVDSKQVKKKVEKGIITPPINYISDEEIA